MTYCLPEMLQGGRERERGRVRKGEREGERDREGGMDEGGREAVGRT